MVVVAGPPVVGEVYPIILWMLWGFKPHVDKTSWPPCEVLFQGTGEERRLGKNNPDCPGC